MRKTARRTLLAVLTACTAIGLSAGIAACKKDTTPPTPTPRYENPQTATYTATVTAGNKKISDVVVTWTNRSTGLVSAVAHTNAEGVATCNIVPAEYSVTIVGYSTTLYANKGGARFADTATTSVTFELSEIVTSTYTVYVEAGAEGLSGAGIAWINADTGEIAATMLTDADGYATAVLETGDYYTVLEEYSTGYIDTQGTQLATVSSPRVAYSLTAMSGMGRQTTPYYTYVTASSTPVEGVGIVFYNDEQLPVYATFTDENGSVRANITNSLDSTGTYTVKMSGYTALGYTATEDSGTVSLQSDRIDFELTRSITASNSYDIRVTSKGGMALRGVTVNLLQNGVVVASGVTNTSGRASIFCEFGDYTVTFSAPTGFFADANTEYKVSTDIHDYTFALDSSVIDSTAPSNKLYAIGDVMYDFSVRDAVTNDTLILSELLERYKAVVLNFWYIGCSPCRVEFPFIQGAYEEYQNDIAFIAITNQDSTDSIRQFKTGTHPLNSNVYTFNMCSDTANLTSAFNVAAFPTTVVVDRYSVVAYATSGNDTSSDSWKNMFQTYIADDYTQDITQGSGTTSGSGTTDRERPDVAQDAFDETYINALADSNYASKISASQLAIDIATDSENADPYTWPFNVEQVAGENVISATNVNHESSYSILYVNDITLKADTALVFEYDILSEDYDILYVLIDLQEKDSADFQIYGSLSGNSGTWTQCIPYVATEDITISLSFCYLKDSTTSVDGEHVYIRKLNVIDIADATTHTDVRHDAATNKINEATGYANYVTPVYNANDGYYHVGSENGPLLYMELLFQTPYSDLHISTFAQEFAVYYIATNVLGRGSLNFNDEADHAVINGVDYIDVLGRYVRAQSNSDNGSVPVTQDLYNFMQIFLDEITSAKYGRNYGTTRYENQWLEFCHYYVHYGELAQGEKCYAYDDPILGLTVNSAISVDFKGNFTGRVGYSETVAINDYRGLVSWRGTRTKFTAPANGVYSFYGSGRGEVDPYGYVVNPEHEERILVQCEDFLGRDGFDYGFMIYVYLEQGETLYLVCAQAAQSTGVINLTITYEATTSLDVVTTADRGLGMSSYEIDDDGNIHYYYIAIPVILDEDDGYYHSLIGGEEGSILYLDFLTESAVISGSTVENVLQNGGFDLRATGRGNYQVMMQALYNKAISRDRNDPLYGLVEVDKDVQEALNAFLESQYEQFADISDLDSNMWVGFCWYIQTVGANFKYHAA